MAKLLNKSRELIGRAMRPTGGSPLPSRFVIENALLRDEVERLKQRLLELEQRISGEKVIMIRDITKEEAKEEIRRLLKGGHTLYFSDIADKLRLDLEMVVDICRELQGDKEIGIDEDALARTK